MLLYNTCRMLRHRFTYLTKNVRGFRVYGLWITLILFGIIIINWHFDRKETKTFESFDEVKILLDELFDPSTSLINLQIIWNKLIRIWNKILIKFLDDSCQICHRNQSYCEQSIDLKKYIYYINQSFYPFNEKKRPNGMGIFYSFDLKTIHSLNNSILSTDITYCDYFHTIQLIINVQIILHQANIKYFLTKGTLIGTLRHHDIIPWDTDIDLFIPSLSTKKLVKSFQQLSLLKKPKQNLAIYGYKNTYNIISYKIFSLQSTIVNGTNYRWPKIDIHTYQENSTHIYAHPTHEHNSGTMKYILKTDIEPIYLRLLGPLLVPSPYHPRKSIKSMVRLGRSNVFYVCQGNTFLHRFNQGSIDTWRIPCQELYYSYPFVQSEYNSTNNLCYEQLISHQKNQTLSLYIYKCDENLQRIF